MTSPTPRSGILDIKPYKGGEAELEGIARPAKLSSNEGALGPSPKAVAAYCAVGPELHRYPEGGSIALRAAIAKRFSVDAERIVCGAGSDELIQLLIRSYVNPGDEVLYSQYGFLMYAIASRTAGAVPVAAEEVDLKASIDNMLAKVSPKTRVVFLANPNNPTGTCLSTEEVRRLREKLPADVLLILDAAYAEFVDRNDYDPGVALVEECDNVVMLRTFSKIFGMGGMRLGWAYCPPAIADVLNRVRGPFNVSSSAQAAGIAALEDTEFTELAKRHNDYWMPWFTEQVRALGLVAVPSVGNFVLVRFPRQPGKDSVAADAYLRKKGIIVRPVANYGLGDSLRVSIGTGEEMQATVAALTEFVGK